MGTAGYLLSSRSVFLVTFILAIPTLLALRAFASGKSTPRGARRGGAGGARRQRNQRREPGARRPLLIFAGGVLLLQLANAAMLPIMAGVVTTRSSHGRRR